MLFVEVARASAEVAQTSSKKQKTALLATLLRAVPPDERAIAARQLSGECGHKTGIGYATVHELRSSVPPAAEPQLTLTEVDRRLAALAELSGKGSATARKQGFGALLARATELEQGFIGAIILGELRQGALDALVVDALAVATSLPANTVRGAYMLAGDIGLVADAALGDGAEGIARFGLTLFRPVLPMLAQTAEDPTEALASFGGPAALELKLDGFRVQIHKDDDIVRVYSRALNEVTGQVPEVVAYARALPAKKLILDGEAIVLGEGGRPLPFQDTMKRFGKRRDPNDAAPLSLSLFDALLIDEQTMLSVPARERFTALDALAPAHAVPRLVTADAAEATAFYERAIASGHEGVMAKALDAPYDAGSRGAAWLKIKHVHRLDLVVLAAEWGSGRRRGFLSNLWLGARDPAGGEPIMLGKTFKGMTDEILAWQTQALQAIELDRDGHVVHVRPEKVVEIAFNDVQRSSHYPGGLALRFARLVRYRDDKTAAQADTIDAVRAIAIHAGVLPPS
ncbi:MAG: ATP-dependent DNA ligase [Deltaproteobacteria bacterium]|nr:ATP-dependent DNA ligase [Deltaproteobacteria bacterium]